MRKTLGGASGVVMVAAVNGVVAGGPWIVVSAVGGALAVWFSLLVFVDKLAFCTRAEPTSRVIALVGAVKSPSSPPGRRNRRRAKPPGQP
jgi:F0F1-type ATP synthase assembly protein I